MENGIILDSVTKCFDGGVTAVNQVSLEIAAGEFMVLVGPSGCGKSTLLRLIAGLEDVTAGSITLGGREVTYLEPKDRDIAMVFQNYALYPHMTVEKNLAFSLTLRDVAKSEVKAKVDEAARILGLDGLLKRKPAALSGGQRQRVAIGRAMVRDPQVFLMDEPLSNLDAKLRVQMRTELARLHAELRTTTVYVTHDQIEAMTLGDRVAVMRDGLIQQVDTPDILFTEPANLFVAAFMGSPSMNLVQGTVRGRHAHFGSHRLPITDTRVAARFDGRDVIIGIRPTSFDAAALVPDSSWPRLEAAAQLVENLGTEQHVIFAIDAPPVETDDTQAAADDGVSEANFVLAQTGRRAIWVARVGAGVPVRPGEKISLAFNPNSLYLFDPQTGRSLRESHRGRPAEAQQVAVR